MRRGAPVAAVCLAAGAALLVFAGPCGGKTLRFSSQGDYLSADPHATNEALTNSLNSHVFEALVSRGPDLELRPALATHWRRTSPTTWIFHLRRNVRFHDGTPFDADDVVFSIARARGATSTFRVFANGVGEARRIDEHTVELRTEAPQPVMLEMLGGIFIMSGQWCRMHGALEAQDFRHGKESYTSRHANGTGPFVLVTREPDRHTIFERNFEWWGWNEDPLAGNVARIVYVPMKNAAARVAALLAGSIDLVVDPPVQHVDRLRREPSIVIHEGRENRVVFLGFDQWRDELPGSGVRGRNPFKDRRVRQAIYQAIDVESIQRKVMRGLSIPTAINLPNPSAAGIPSAMDRRHPYDPRQSRKLLAQAGLADGFRMALDCPNNRYVADESICVAVAGMLSKVGIQVTVRARPFSEYFPRLLRREVSFFLLGAGGPNTDAIFTLLQVMHSRTDTGEGDLNIGQYRDDQLDALIDAARTDLDPARRQETINHALQRHHEQIHHIPLHLQVIPWASRANTEVIHRADNWLQATWVKMK